MIQYQAPPQREGLLDKISKGLGVATQVLGVANGVQDFRTKSAAIDKQKALDDPNSAESKAARDAYAKYGQQVQPTESASALERRLGAASNFAKERFQTDEKIREDQNKTHPQEITSRKDLFNFQAQGAALVPPGTPGATAMTVPRTDGKGNEVVWLKPPSSAPTNKDKFDALPMESQEQIKKLAQQNANKTSISNQLKATYKTLIDPSVPYEQKYMAAKNLGKTLNSTEGADAVSDSERRAMMSFLNYTPVDRPGWDFGPQIEKFAEQVRLKSGDIDKAIIANSGQIDALYGRSGGPAMPISLPPRRMPGKGANAVAGERPRPDANDQAALQWLKANPKSPDAAGVAAKLKKKGLL